MENLTRGRLFILFGLTTIPLLIFTFAVRKKKVVKRTIEENSDITSLKILADYAKSGKDCGGQQSPSTPNGWQSLGFEEPLVIAMVGLPARGKSYISKMLMRYLRWTGFECELFNVGSYRREMGFASADSTFFASGNKDGNKVREELAMSVQEYMYTWLKSSDGNKRRVAIFDATNTTISRRLTLAKRARSEGVFLLFIESICDDPKVLAQNYALKLNNDDYKQMDPQKALDDFMDRVKAYERVYEPIQDNEDNDNISYIKMVNVGEKIITRNCTGYLPSQVALYLQNIHIKPRRIYLTLNADIAPRDSQHVGQGAASGRFRSISNADSNLSSASTERLAGMSDSYPTKLTESGREYAKDLARYFKAKFEVEQDIGNFDSNYSSAENDLGNELMVLTGTSSIHTDTVTHLRMLFKCFNTPLLNELRGGDLQGMRPEEVQATFPEEYEKRQSNKFEYRYPGIHGESYRDVIERLQPIIIELERQRQSVLIVCHLAVLRCLYAYFMDVKLEDAPKQLFEKHVLYELSPGPFGCVCKKVNPTDELPHM